MSYKAFAYPKGKYLNDSLLSPLYNAGFKEDPNDNSYSHGDIEYEALSNIFTGDNGKKIISQIYFGNWLRDFSQAICGATLKDKSFYLPDFKNKKEKCLKKTSLSLSQEGWVKIIGLMAIKEFTIEIQTPTKNGNPELSNLVEEYFTKFNSDYPNILIFRKEDNSISLTPQAINIVGIYRPEEHIDNPKFLKDESNLDAKFETPNKKEIRLYDGENKHLDDFQINSKGLKRYIQNSVEYAKKQIEYSLISNDEKIKYMHFGASLHVIEDYFAHSNFVEIALIKNLQIDTYPFVEEFIHKINNSKLSYNQLIKIEDLSELYNYSVISNSIDFNSVQNKFKKKEILDIKKLRCFLLSSAIPVTTGYFSKPDLFGSILPKLREFLFPINYKELDFLKNEKNYTFNDVVILNLLKEISDFEDEYSWYVENRNILATNINEAKRDVNKENREKFLRIDRTLNLLNSFRNSFNYLINIPFNKLLEISDNVIGDIQTIHTNFTSNPSHTQLAKDERDNPLNQLTGLLAVEAVKRVGQAYKDSKTPILDIYNIIESIFVHPCHSIDETWQDKIIVEWCSKQENTKFIEHIKYKTDINWIYHRIDDKIKSKIKDLECEINMLRSKLRYIKNEYNA